MTTTPVDTGVPLHRPDQENKWLARYDDDKHGAHADTLYGLNPSAPEDFVKVGAVTLAEGLTPDKLYVRMFREGDTYNSTPLATFRWEAFTVPNIVKEIRSPGWYKVTLHGRWRHGGMLKQHRIELTADHFGSSMPAVVAPVAVSGGNFNANELVGKLLERVLLGGQGQQTNDVIGTAERFYAVMDRMRPEKKGPTVEEIVEQVVTRIGPARGDRGIDWGRLIENALAKLPQVVEAFKASPSTAAASTPPASAPVADSTAAESKSGGVAELLPLLRLGIASKSLPDAYAVIVADSLRQIPPSERAAILGMETGALVEILIQSAPDLAPARDWLGEVEDMMKAEFAEEGGEDGKSTTANQS